MDDEAFGAEFQVRWLLAQADEANNIGQYATMEYLLKEARRLADGHLDLPIRIEVAFWLAHAWRMQGHFEEAVADYVWFMELITDPQKSSQVAGSYRALKYLPMVFSEFVEAGRYLPSMPLAQLHQVLDRGLAFLQDIGKEEHTCNLRYQKGLVLKEEGRLQEAQRELEIALALRNRHSPELAYTKGTFLFNLGDVSRMLGDHESAKKYYLEVVEGGWADPWSRAMCAIGMAKSAREQEDLLLADYWAGEGVTLANQVESPEPCFMAQSEQLEVLLAQGSVANLAQEAAALWQWGRRWNTERAKYLTAKNLAQTRLGMARHSLGLAPDPSGPVPDGLPEVPRQALAAARRWLAAAQGWLARAEYTGQRLDRQEGVESRGKKLESFKTKARALSALVRRKDH